MWKNCSKPKHYPKNKGSFQPIENKEQCKNVKFNLKIALYILFFITTKEFIEEEKESKSKEHEMCEDYVETADREKD